MELWNNLIKQIRKRERALFFTLIDPDNMDHSKLKTTVQRVKSLRGDAILVGGSTLFKDNLPQLIDWLKDTADLPVIIFPGNSKFIVPQADLVLFLSLLSGRNPRWLIEEQLEMAVKINQYNLPSIPVAYLLVESGSTTTVEFISNTRPIPRSKPEVLAAHVLAANSMGMVNVYLEGGSGAKLTVPEQMIEVAALHAQGKVIVGGGITSPGEVESKVKAGADIIVVGTAVERNIEVLPELISAAGIK
ncbi:MAG: geranylgeranylglyceryl/heptaprenylglyceryl phosphate synthase [bacterium]